MEALADFDVTVTFCFTPEHRGIEPHHTSAAAGRPRSSPSSARAMVARYSDRVAPQRSLAVAG